MTDENEITYKSIELKEMQEEIVPQAGDGVTEGKGRRG